MVLHVACPAAPSPLLMCKNTSRSQIFELERKKRPSTTEAVAERGGFLRKREFLNQKGEKGEAFPKERDYVYLEHLQRLSHGSDLLCSSSSVFCGCGPLTGRPHPTMKSCVLLSRVAKGEEKEERERMRIGAADIIWDKKKSSLLCTLHKKPLCHPGGKLVCERK